MLCLPTRVGFKTVEWPQIDFFAIPYASGVHPSGTDCVRARKFIPADSIFPCVGKYEKLKAQCARFSPACVSPTNSKWVVNGCPNGDSSDDEIGLTYHTVALSAGGAGGVSGTQHSVAVGCGGWSFFPYCREPPPSLTLSTAGICTHAPKDWRVQPLYADFVPLFDELAAGLNAPDESDVGPSPPLSVIVIKRDLEPGEELLIAFNQFDGIGRIYAYSCPCPFLRIGTAVPMLCLPFSMQHLRHILANQASSTITDSYVKLLEDTAGTDARTSERLSTAILNLTRALMYFQDNEGRVVDLPLVVPVQSTLVHGVGIGIGVGAGASGGGGGAGGILLQSNGLGRMIQEEATEHSGLNGKRMRSSSSSERLLGPEIGTAAPKRPTVPIFPSSFRIPQSYIP